MRNTLLLLLITVSQAYADKSYSQETLLNLDLQNVTLGTALEEIEIQSEFYFLFNAKLIDIEREVSVSTKNQKIFSILDKLLKDSNVEYFVYDRQIVLSSKEHIASLNEKAKQPNQITGRVTDNNGDPIIGATVMVKGTSIGTITDLSGKYSLSNVPENATLIFSFVGMKKQEVEVGNQSQIDVTMILESIGIEEVVAVGYGTKSRNDLTGSISSLNEENLEKANYNTIDQTIQGRAPGVLVTSNSGEPGGNVTVRIRGNNSINGNNDPLYVIDGMPVSALGEASGVDFSSSGNPLSGLNPQDIESIDILKDASSTAIYGSRGANGVIMITTKRGKQGKPTIGLSTNFTVSTIRNIYEMLNGADYALYRNEANAALGQVLPFPNPNDFNGKGINWTDEITRKGLRQNYSLNFSGGQNNLNYYASGSYLKDEGIILGSDLERGNLKLNLDFKALDEKLNINLNLNASQIKSNRALTQSTGFPDAAGVILNALMASPLVPSLEFSGITAEDEQFYNPYLEARDKTDLTKNVDAYSNVEMSYRLLKDLTITANGGFNHKISDRDVFFPKTVAAGVLQNGVANINEFKSNNYTLSSYFNYKPDLSEVHSFNATLGYEYNQFDESTQSASVSGFEDDRLGLDALQVGTSRNSIASNRTSSILKSGFVRLNYSYKYKYLLTFTARADGSSKFAENNKWAFFPSVAAAWKVSNEEFMRNSSFVTNLKLRLSYGESGNQAIQPYQSLPSYGTTVYPIGNVATLAYIPVTVSNPNLRWETTSQFNIGIDLGIFKNRLEFTFDYFDKTTNDLIQNISLPSQSGYSNALINFGSNRNRGYELGIDAEPIRSGNFSWNSGINLSSYKTTVLELGGSEEIFGPGLGANLTGIGHIFRTGEEYAVFYGLEVIGLIQEEDFDSDGNIQVPVYSNDDQLGHWKYKDINDDGIINADDRTIIGNPNPDFIIGWNNELSYKNLTLSFMFQGTIGNDIYNVMGTILNSGFKNEEHYKNQTKEWWENRWTNDNPHNDIRYPSINSAAPPVSSRMVEDGSYLRLKNLSLRYNVPVNSNHIGNLQVYITGTNLLTFTNYSGVDPEVSQFGSSNLAPGVDLGAYPSSKFFMIGLNIQL